MIPYRIGRAVLVQPDGGRDIEEDAPFLVVGLRVLPPDGHDQLGLNIQVRAAAKNGHLNNGGSEAGWNGGCTSTAGRVYGAACGIASYADELAFTEELQLLVVQGTATQINTQLAQLHYRSRSNYVGTDNITVEIYEESYTEGVYSSTAADMIEFSINVQPVNDKPKVSSP